MANNYVKISELPAMQTIAGSDILPIVDTSETETKKVTKQMLLTDIDANEVQIDQLTEATQINDEDLLIITQNGVNKKISKANAKFASGDEIFVGDTLPSGDDADSIKLWLTDDDALEGEGNYISNEYGTSQEIGYSQEYLNNSIVETGGNATDGYIKYGNGIMIQWSSITGTQGTLTAWGSLYYKDVSLGNWTTAFTTLYNVSVSNRSNQFLCSLDSASNTSKGNVRIVRPDAGYSSSAYNIQLLAIGTWK